MSRRLWTRESIVDAIRIEARSGRPLSYSQIQGRMPTLLRAAERIFGSWGAAVEAAGFDYSSVRRYRVWTREHVVERIRELHRQGHNLNWRHVATQLDPSLAAAVLHAHRFNSWTEALEAAGLDPTVVLRYRRWNLTTIRAELARLAAQGVSLDQETLSKIAPSLRAAIYRVPGGLDAQRQALRAQRGEETTTPEA